MKIQFIGSGQVAQTLAGALAGFSHEVAISSRSLKEQTQAWCAANQVGYCTFAELADADIYFNCTQGKISLEAIKQIPTGVLTNKILVDVANPMDLSHGIPPTLSLCNETSLAESLQNYLITSKVVKVLNTVAADVMIAPGMLGGEHILPICGDDADAKHQVQLLLEEFGWLPDQFVDFGGIVMARGMEMYMTLWSQLYQSLGDAHFNIALVRETE